MRERKRKELENGMKKTSFEEYINKLSELEANGLSASLSELIFSVSESDAKRMEPDASFSSARNIIRELASFFGKQKPDTLTEDMPFEKQLEYGLYKLGLLKRRIVLRGGWWSDTTGPLLCKMKETGRYVLLLPLALGGYQFFHPELKKNVRIRRKLAEELSEEAYCFYQTLPNRPIGFWGVIKFAAGFIPLLEIIYAVFVSILVLAVNMSVPLLNRVLFGTVIPSGVTKDIWAIAGLLLGVAVASVSFQLVKGLGFKRTAGKAEMYLTGAVWSRALNLPADFFKKHTSNEIYRKIEAVNDMGTIFFGSSVSTLLSALLSSVYIFQISGIVPSLTLPAVSIGVLTVGVSALLSIQRVRYHKKQILLKSKLNGFIFEIFMGIAKIKVAGARIRVFSKWAEKYCDLTKAAYSPNVLIPMADALYTLLTMGTTIFIYFIAAKNKVVPADFIAFNVAYASFTTMLLRFRTLVAEAARLMSLYDLAKPVLQAVPENIGALRKVEKLDGNIELNNISFRYSEDSPLVLDKVSLNIRQGEYVAITGASGCGKSTLLRIMLGFEKPQSGTIHFDNQDINGLDVISLRRHIGAVLQNGTLFAGDIYANITICNPYLSVEEAFEVAKKAGLEEDINNMPMGIFTLIGEGAEGISEGQKQRLMIARAFAANPSIIMFDEATSALDNISQGKIIRALEEFRATKIVIAHRLSTIKRCDRIIVLDDGRIAEEGTYDQLMQRGGLFYKMAQRQLV